MRHRVFKNPDVLLQMLHLRLLGWQLHKLAHKYNVDRSSIYHWCNKFNIEPIFFERSPTRQRTFIQFTFTTPQKVSKYQHLLDEEEQVNTGKNYLQYRVESRRRELIRNGIL